MASPTRIHPAISAFEWRPDETCQARRLRPRTPVLPFARRPALPQPKSPKSATHNGNPCPGVCWSWAQLAHKRIGLLLDHLIRSSQHRRRDRHTKGLGRLEIDHELELRRLLDGQVGGLGALEDLVHVRGRTPEEFAEVRSIR